MLADSATPLPVLQDLDLDFAPLLGAPSTAEEDGPIAPALLPTLPAKRLPEMAVPEQPQQQRFRVEVPPHLRDLFNRSLRQEETLQMLAQQQTQNDEQLAILRREVAALEKRDMELKLVRAEALGEYRTTTAAITTALKGEEEEARSKSTLNYNCSDLRLTYTSLFCRKKNG